MVTVTKIPMFPEEAYLFHGLIPDQQRRTNFSVAYYLLSPNFDGDTSQSRMMSESIERLLILLLFE